mmetsp:Transcript_3688/g.14021  ORF Transcript_3688/g.14021 Transcript_3688/m.14021 type:complete len:433 (+) Transcript_3688:171-1469(+)|eukprot:CAMPEP_0117441652 /NCGR_PEP_ID=MMETSP0759-20121206/3744_1 /TAXON_ID=63605 /ORGANISM="Percolomonas cosmopolitus, Strain WS" /LENGTH=432 /DNA_ID=CAMNT_0005233511 /DNA_START=298 /DNA_END=1596 /DNA_ORIENTATION=+
MGSCLSKNHKEHSGALSHQKRVPKTHQGNKTQTNRGTSAESWKIRRRNNFISLVLPRHEDRYASNRANPVFRPPRTPGATHIDFKSGTPHSPISTTSPDLTPNDTDDSTLDARIYSWLPQINHPQFGCLQNKLPLIKRFMVDENDNQCVEVGTLVKRLLFADEIGYPEGFVCNVTTAIGDFSSECTYSNPNSIWFNVGLGFYGIVAPITEDFDDDVDWHRPFGYEDDGQTVRTEDILRLLFADWNFFTAYMYGVPLSECQRTLPNKQHFMDLLEKNVRVSAERIQMGDKFFDEITFTRIPCVSTYLSRSEGAARLTPNSGLTALWQEALGIPIQDTPSKFPDSFIECKMSGTLWMSWSRKRDGFHTVAITGGFCNETVADNGLVTREENLKFLDVQKSAVKRTVESFYSDLGFDTNLDHSTLIESIRIDEKK